MSLFETAEFDGHEAVAFLTDRRTRLRAILAIHDTTLDPALGGCRMLPYASPAEALRDALRLSQAMTYKAACAGIPFGGGCGVRCQDGRASGCLRRRRGRLRAVRARRCAGRGERATARGQDRGRLRQQPAPGSRRRRSRLLDPAPSPTHLDWA